MIFLLLCAAQVRVVASLAEGTAVPLLQCPLYYRFGQKFGILSWCQRWVAYTLHEGHRGIFNIHQLMSVDGTSGLTSIRGTARTH